MWLSLLGYLISQYMTVIYTMIIRPPDNSRGFYILPLSFIHSNTIFTRPSLRSRTAPPVKSISEVGSYVKPKHEKLVVVQLT